MLSALGSDVKSKPIYINPSLERLEIFQSHFRETIKKVSIFFCTRAYCRYVVLKYIGTHMEIQYWDTKHQIIESRSCKMREKLAKMRGQWELNPWPVDLQSTALPLSYTPEILLNISTSWQFSNIGEGCSHGTQVLIQF